MSGPDAIDLLALAAAVPQGPFNQVFMADGGHRARLTLTTSVGPWHRHPNTPETFLVLQGELVLEFRNERPVRLSPGMALSVPAGVSHRSAPGTPQGRAVSVSLEAQDQQVILEE
ncbi:cupin domain-containing protein (plasmid) [Deinococcus sp. KNUC1210]|uniref:cupin domain-containing protein n=1 Tax=Deinococcus sp. KNUC1210 TaxID=2917691 RepID=UPI001EF071F3|nr:cupin domain-containing protein [Deinococcus sp. KNUC1210]ULH14226.1 cupin domain-containing protein [Deinococcus sp. KNUC1210]